MRLDKALQSQGFGSRKGCRALVEAGRVRVNGVPAGDPDAEVDERGLVFTVDGADWPYAARLVLALHKPAQVECSHAPTHHPSVFSLLPAHVVARGVECVGRLDADTTGLLLLTDDGALLQRLTSPRRGVHKRYLVGCAAPVTDEQLRRLRDGVTLNDAPEPVRGQAERAGEQRLRLTIGEGRYHQVKRMVAAAGNHVVSLHREQLGGLALPDGLAPGQWQVLDDAALALLEAGAGGGT